jgi:hypothetical protein
MDPIPRCNEAAKILLYDSHGNYLSEVAEISSYPDSRFSIAPDYSPTGGIITICELSVLAHTQLRGS